MELPRKRLRKVPEKIEEWYRKIQELSKISQGERAAAKGSLSYEYEMRE
jgi:hypothetical protein